MSLCSEIIASKASYWQSREYIYTGDSGRGFFSRVLYKTHEIWFRSFIRASASLFDIGSMVMPVNVSWSLAASHRTFTSWNRISTWKLIVKEMRPFHRTNKFFQKQKSTKRSYIYKKKCDNEILKKSKKGISDNDSKSITKEMRI